MKMSGVMSTKGVKGFKETKVNSVDCSSSIVPFRTLIQQRNFQKIINIIDKNELVVLLEWLRVDGRINAENKQSTHTCNGRVETALHLCCKVQPTIDLVQVLLEVCHMQTDYAVKDCVDMFGKTPLHLAVIHGCSPGVVRLLAEGCSAPLCRDAYKRLPLHWAAAASCPRNDTVNNIEKIHCLSFCSIVSNRYGRNITNKTRNRQEQAKRQDMFDIFKILIEAYPEAVLAKDSFGLTPLDLVDDTQIRTLFIKAAELLQQRKQIYPPQKIQVEICGRGNDQVSDTQTETSSSDSSTLLASGVPMEIIVTIEAMGLRKHPYEQAQI